MIVENQLRGHFKHEISEKRGSARFYEQQHMKVRTESVLQFIFSQNAVSACDLFLN